MMNAQIDEINGYVQQINRVLLIIGTGETVKEQIFIKQMRVTAEEMNYNIANLKKIDGESA